MIKKILAFLLTFVIIFAALGGSVYAGVGNFKDFKNNGEPIVVVGVSKSNLENKYGELSDEEFQEIFDSGVESVFNNIKNKESNFELMRSENKYLDMFDIKIIDNLSNGKSLNDNGINSLPTKLPTRPFSDHYGFAVIGQWYTCKYVIYARGTIYNNREASIERAWTDQLTGPYKGNPAPRYTPGGSTMSVFLYEAYFLFAISSGGYIYMI